LGRFDIEINAEKRTNWMLASYFNTPLLPSEKSSGITDLSDSMADLANFLNQTGPMDVEVNNQLFSWTNRRRGD